MDIIPNTSQLTILVIFGRRTDQLGSNPSDKCDLLLLDVEDLASVVEGGKDIDPSISEYLIAVPAADNRWTPDFCDFTSVVW